MDSIVMAIIVVTVIGLVGAVILVVASIFMYVPVDERVEKITAALPGANGGACGCANEAEKGDAEEERAVVVGARDECEGRPEVGHLCSVPVCVEVKCFGCHEDSLPNTVCG